MLVFYKYYTLFFLSAAFFYFGSTSILRKDSNSKSNCPVNEVTVSVFVDPPYAKNNSNGAGVMGDFIRLGIKSCFKSKSCTKAKDMQWNWVQSVDELESLIKNEQMTIAFPVPPSLSTRKTRSGKARVEYYSVLRSPGPALIVNSQACQRISKLLLVKTILSVWPILVLTLLLAGISGVCIWALEYRNDQRLFSRPFAKGSYDGFWWAVVSMTTVGYGDQIPRSIVGRLFGIVWILTGVTLIAVFTASITSAITVVSVKEPCTEIQGKHIAVVNNSEVEVTARHHGAVVKAYDDVTPMFSDLKSGQVDGILMDRLKAYYYLNIMGDDMLRVSRVLEDPVSYGVAVVPGNMTHIITNNSCFMDMLDNPKGKINRVMKRYIVPVKPMASSEDAIGLFSNHSDAFTNTLLAITAVLVVLVMCGCVWDQVYKGNRCCSPTEVPRQVLTNTKDIPMENQAGLDDQLDQIQSVLKTLNEQILELSVKVAGKAQEQET